MFLFSPPKATPSFLISTNPLVINAAKVLSRKPIPAATPAQKMLLYF